MDQPEKLTGQATAEPEEPEETIQGDLLRQKQELKDGSRVSNFYEASHPVLPCVELTIVDLCNGLVIRQCSIRGLGHNIDEACKLFDHAIARIKDVKAELYPKEKKK